MRPLSCSISPRAAYRRSTPLTYRSSAERSKRGRRGQRRTWWEPASRRPSRRCLRGRARQADAVSSSTPLKSRCRFLTTTSSRRCFIPSTRRGTPSNILLASRPVAVSHSFPAGFPGSIPDNELTEACGLKNGDAVMADRGFTEFHRLRELGCELIIPSLSQFKGDGHGHEHAAQTAAENEHTYYVAHVRIHVERMMRQPSRPGLALLCCARPSR
mmetsp:Transcript_19243/g.56715  ORF Transcript_19243/g.56715 Transcript_19243/m.56715 type:complete len:215 (+) Transcript_19243:1362-2006(+)